MEKIKVINRKHSCGGFQEIQLYDNGYGVSVVNFDGSYGYSDGLLEMAVIKGGEDDWSICYDTYITDDVMGHLTLNEVFENIKKVKELPNEPE